MVQALSLPSLNKSGHWVISRGDIFGAEFDKNRLQLKTLQDYVKLYGNRGPEFDPGSQWKYSNYGFLLLGVIVEKVSGQSYYDYVRVLTVSMVDRIIGCPHEEAVDYPDGEWCPKCPFWRNRDRFTGEMIN